MNREDVIQLAREAGLTNLLRDTQKTHDYLERFAKAVEQRTLERAAQKCGELADKFHAHAADCAAAIRALGEKA